MQPIVLNTQPIPMGSQRAIAAAIAAVAQATIALQLDEVQMDSMWQTSVAAFLDSMADIALAQGCMQGHAYRIKADHCELGYRRTEVSPGKYQVEQAYRWKQATSKGADVMFTAWQRDKALEVHL